MNAKEAAEYVLHESVRTKQMHFDARERQLGLALEAGNILAARVAELEGHLDIEKKLTHEMESERDGAMARVAELDHSLADAMEQIEAIQGTSQVHIDRVAALEEANDSISTRAAKMSYEVIRRMADNFCEALGVGVRDDPVESAKAMRTRVAELEARDRRVDGMCLDWTVELDKAKDRVAALVGELREWRCDTVPGRCRGCPDCQPIGGTMPATLARNAADDQRGEVKS